MLFIFHGIAGEYMLKKEMRRLDRRQHRPWELEKPQPNRRDLLALLVVPIIILIGLLLVDLF